MRILVTGAQGRLGRALRPSLDERDDLDVRYTISPRETSDDPAVSTMDLDNAEDIRRIVERVRPEVIVHLGGIHGVACEADPALTERVNVDAVRTLASAAVAVGPCRFILISTAAVYGDDYRTPIPETGAISLPSLYARSKFEAEELLRELSEQDPAIETLALRVFNIYGRGFTQSLVNRLIDSTPDTPVVLNGLENFIRDYVHVDDVTHAIRTGIDVPLDTASAVYNIASGEPVSNAELLRRLSSRHELHYLVEGDQDSYSCADISRAHADLGLDPVLIPAE